MFELVLSISLLILMICFQLIYVAIRRNHLEQISYLVQKPKPRLFLPYYLDIESIDCLMDQIHKGMLPNKISIVATSQKSSGFFATLKNRIGINIDKKNINTTTKEIDVNSHKWSQLSYLYDYLLNNEIIKEIDLDIFTKKFPIILPFIKEVEADSGVVQDIDEKMDAIDQEFSLLNQKKENEPSLEKLQALLKDEDKLRYKKASYKLQRIRDLEFLDVFQSFFDDFGDLEDFISIKGSFSVKKDKEDQIFTLFCDLKNIAQYFKKFPQEIEIKCQNEFMTKRGKNYVLHGDIIFLRLIGIINNTIYNEKVLEKISITPIGIF